MAGLKRYKGTLNWGLKRNDEGEWYSFECIFNALINNILYWSCFFLAVYDDQVTISGVSGPVTWNFKVVIHGHFIQIFSNCYFIGMTESANLYLL